MKLERILTSEFEKMFSGMISADDCYKEFTEQIDGLLMPRKQEYLEFIHLQFKDRTIDHFLSTVHESQMTHFIEILEEDEIDGPAHAVSYAHNRWIEDKKADLDYGKKLVQKGMERCKKISATIELNETDEENDLPSSERKINNKQKALLVYLLDKHGYFPLDEIHVNLMNKYKFLSILLDVDKHNFRKDFNESTKGSKTIHGIYKKVNLRALSLALKDTHYDKVKVEIQTIINSRK
jgi:hypothetical protein